MRASCMLWVFQYRGVTPRGTATFNVYILIPRTCMCDTDSVCGRRLPHCRDGNGRASPLIVLRSFLQRSFLQRIVLIVPTKYLISLRFSVPRLKGILAPLAPLIMRNRHVRPQIESNSTCEASNCFLEAFGLENAESPIDPTLPSKLVFAFRGVALV